MGYTHYTTQKKRFSNKDWATVTADILAILTVAMDDGIVLGDWSGENRLTAASDAVTAGEVGFNGFADARCETFVVTQERPPLESWQSKDRRGWSFCKTRREEYDSAVVAVLCYLESAWPSHISVGSDGNARDWQDGLALAKRALPRLGNVLDVPVEVRF